MSHFKQALDSRMQILRKISNGVIIPFQMNFFDSVFLKVTHKPLAQDNLTILNYTFLGSP